MLKDQSRSAKSLVQLGNTFTQSGCGCLKECLQLSKLLPLPSHKLHTFPKTHKKKKNQNNYNKKTAKFLRLSSCSAGHRPSGTCNLVIFEKSVNTASVEKIFSENVALGAKKLLSASEYRKICVRLRSVDCD